MTKNYHHKIFIALISIFLCFSLVFAMAPKTNALFENAKKDACAGANLQDSSPGNCGDKASRTLTKRIQTVINLFSVIIGIIAVIMIIIAGLRYITSGGDANGITAAKNALIYAIVGLIVAALAQVIVKFVLGKVA